MKKITWSEMERRFLKHNKRKDNPIYAVVVFKKENWDVPYTEEERSYKVSSNNKAFKEGMISKSIFADCLDGKDLGVRLDWYDWEVEYCYMVEE